MAADAPTLVVGIGASKGVTAGEVLGLVEEVLREAGLPARSVARLATVDTKAAEPGIVAAAERLGVPLVAYSAGELAAVAVPNPSTGPLAAVGTPSVAEAAALLGGGELLVPKRKSTGRPARATCAVARRPGGGRHAVVGRDHAPGTPLPASDPATLDMMTGVTAGTAATRAVAGRTVTPQYRPTSSWETP